MINNTDNNMFFFSLPISAQVPDSDEQFVPDFHSENCEYFHFLCQY